MKKALSVLLIASLCSSVIAMDNKPEQPSKQMSAGDVAKVVGATVVAIAGLCTFSGVSLFIVNRLLSTETNNRPPVGSQERVLRAEIKIIENEIKTIDDENKKEMERIDAFKKKSKEALKWLKDRGGYLPKDDSDTPSDTAE
jgi:hypothetical protein